MRFPNRQRLAIFMMTFSLVLLGVFLLVFLQKVYRDETDRLKRETSLLFVNTVQGIEGEIFDKIIIRRIDHLPDVEINLPPGVPGVKRMDSVKVITMINEQSTLIRRDTNFKMRVNREQVMTGNADVKGSLSLMLNFGHKKTPGDSLCLPGIAGPDSNKVMLKIGQGFGKALTASGLPVGFLLMRPDRDSSAARSGFTAGIYTDLISKQRYGAVIIEYNRYIIHQILPQILFALVLFVFISLAFLFIFQTLRQQQRLAEQKNDFIRNMTHELKTPIATVSVAIEAMQHFDALENRERTREYLDISRLELSRLTLLVDKVLRMSLFEKGAPELNLERLDFRLLIEEILTSMKLQFEKYGARVGFHTEGTDFSMAGDRLHLASVVYNLLDNALKYSRNKPEIGVDLVQSNGSMTLQVRDSGIGIPADYRDKIFEKFFRVPSGDIHDVKGHGLGLSYVAGVVNKHHGAITVDSTEGQGTCFSITFQLNNN